MSDERLKPCPFCGSQLERILNKPWQNPWLLYQHPENDCLLSKLVVRGTDIEKWNTRELMERIEERLEERADYLLKDFVLANKAIEVKQKSMCRIEELRGAIDIVKAGGVDATD